MIAWLRGTLLDKGLESVVVEAGGVGYQVAVTVSAHRSLPAAGGEARLHIYTHATQDAPWQLYGFADADERRVFETLLSVQGVGPRVAVAILSGLPVSELVKAVSGGDVARLTQIRGVGRKIAERLTVELRDKIAAAAAGGREMQVIPGAGAAPASAPPGRLGEVHAALLSLGFKPPEFEAVLATLDPTVATPDLVKQALAGMRRK